VPNQPISRSSQRLGSSDHGIGRDAQLLHDHITRCRHACAGASRNAGTNIEKGRTEAVDSDGCTVETDVLGPRARDTGLNGHALAAAAGEHTFFILGGLLVKTMLRGHRHNASARTEFGGGGDGMLQLAATGQNDGVKGRSLLHGDVAAG
jgi:hypothetical protein